MSKLEALQEILNSYHFQHGKRVDRNVLQAIHKIEKDLKEVSK